MGYPLPLLGRGGSGRGRGHGLRLGDETAPTSARRRRDSRHLIADRHDFLLQYHGRRHSTYFYIKTIYVSTAVELVLFQHYISGRFRTGAGAASRAAIAPVPLPDRSAMRDPVLTTSGPVSGHPTAQSAVTAYLGIPYGAPTGGENRWRRRWRSVESRMVVLRRPHRGREPLAGSTGSRTVGRTAHMHDLR